MLLPISFGESCSRYDRNRYSFRYAIAREKESRSVHPLLNVSQSRSGFPIKLHGRLGVKDVGERDGPVSLSRGVALMRTETTSWYHTEPYAQRHGSQQTCWPANPPTETPPEVS
ncbi:hypothetical protein VTN49DRAFT_2705 [Thermomyces lanuginosus]|uniref:uncharacterized protein n=1 Tax=Thermomyces lanuginosus TaxID=5541 RepID=UPI003743C4C3